MTTQRIHVLLVEDNPGDIGLIRSLLGKASSIHFTWEQVEQLSLATDLLRHTPFDIVLLDLSLPDSHGLESFNRLYPHAICLPIVILTTIEEELQALQAVKAGAQDYFVKHAMDGNVLIGRLCQAILRKDTESWLQSRTHDLTVIAQQLEQAIGSAYELNKSLVTLLLRMKVLLEEIIDTPDLIQADHTRIHQTLSPRPPGHDLEEIKAVTALRDGQLSPREQEVLELIARGDTNKEIAKRFSLSVRTVERYRSSIMNKLGLQNHIELVIYAVQRSLLSRDT